MATSGGVVNVAALYAALNSEKESRGLSWRQLASELELSPSTFTRMANGHRPDVEAFASLVRWLGQSAESFISSAELSDQPEPDLAATLAPLLRARKDLTEQDARHLEKLFKAAIAEFHASKAAK